VIRGRPNPENINTSYVERFNLSSRMQMRRCTRLTNGFSKKLENHRAAISLWIAFYNLCRFHETLRCTPAMALGVTDTFGRLASLSRRRLSHQACRRCRTDARIDAQAGVSALQTNSDQRWKNALTRLVIPDLVR
jgi:hypothetical protein